MLRLLLVSFAIASVFSDHARPKVSVIEENIHTNGNEYENEIISVELKKANEDIKFIAQVRIHLIEGHVHINGHRLEHNTVNNIQMMVQVIDIVKGVRQAPQRRAVELRVLIQETNENGVAKLLVEEQFVSIGKSSVEQIDVHQIIWESNIRKPITTVKLLDSHIHKEPKEQDHHMFIADEHSSPHHPGHGFGYEKEEDHHHHHHCRHHHHHQHGNSTYARRKLHDAKCWYHKLSWKSKILLFSVGFLGLLTAVVCCGLCAKRRHSRRLMEVSAPIDDTIVVADDDANLKGGKKSIDNKYEFHFEFDNAVVIDDKKSLVEEA